MSAATHPLVSQVPTGLVSGAVVGRDLDHLATFPGPWESARALCRGQELGGFTDGWHLNAAATGVNPHRICRDCVRVARGLGYAVDVIDAPPPGTTVAI